MKFNKWQVSGLLFFLFVLVFPYLYTHGAWTFIREGYQPSELELAIFKLTNKSIYHRSLLIAAALQNKNKNSTYSSAAEKLKELSVNEKFKALDSIFADKKIEMSVKFDIRMYGKIPDSFTSEQELRQFASKIEQLLIGQFAPQSAYDHHFLLIAGLERASPKIEVSDLTLRMTLSLLKTDFYKSNELFDQLCFDIDSEEALKQLFNYLYAPNTRTDARRRVLNVRARIYRLSSWITAMIKFCHDQSDWQYFIGLLLERRIPMTDDCQTALENFANQTNDLKTVKLINEYLKQCQGNPMSGKKMIEDIHYLGTQKKMKQ